MSSVSRNLPDRSGLPVDRIFGPGTWADVVLDVRSGLVVGPVAGTDQGGEHQQGQEP